MLIVFFQKSVYNFEIITYLILVKGAVPLNQCENVNERHKNKQTNKQTNKQPNKQTNKQTK